MSHFVTDIYGVTGTRVGNAKGHHVVDNRSPFPGLPRPDQGGTPTGSTPMAMASYYSSTADVTEYERGRKRRRGFLFGGLGLALVLLLGGGGAAWAMNSHGDYAYHHLAGGVTGYAQLNLTPSMLERVQAASFLGKLPKTGGEDLQKRVETPATLAKAIVDQIAPGNSVADYSWAGNRYAIAVYGDSTSWTNPDNMVYLLEATDANKAETALKTGLNMVGSNGFSTTAKTAQVLGGNYIVIGDNAAIAKATSQISKLDADPTFTNTYTTAGDPLSYWAESDNQTVTGSIKADWGSMKLTGKTVGSTYAISADAQNTNRTLTANNSLANAVANFGIADPAVLLGPTSPIGQSFLSALGAYTGSTNTAEGKKQLETVLNALGDNVSVSVNNDGSRVLLHGTTQAKINKALTQAAGQKTTIQDLLRGYGSDGNGLKMQNTPDGLLFTTGGNLATKPANLNDVPAGAVVFKMDLDKLPSDVLKNSNGKWGTIAMSVTATTDGTATNATWTLP